MKNIVSIILLLGILCLAGCREDQLVAFTESELTSSSAGQTFSLDIQANCPWKISVSEGLLQVTPDNGEGNKTITVSTIRNLYYDNQKHVLCIQSEDGTSSDILTIIQEAKKGLEVEDVKDMISEEGGTFTLPVKTNDEITKVDTPEWISFTSSRGLSGYTYNFTAEANKTGSIRTGSITINGKNISRTVEVKQDSYAPTGILISEESLASKKSKISTGFKLEPEYADASKLNISSSKGCLAYLEDNTLSVDMYNYGQYYIYVQSEGKTIGEFKALYIPEDILGKLYSRGHYIGQRISIPSYGIECSYSSSNPDVVRVLEEGALEMLSEGTSVISASIPNTDFSGQKEISVRNIVMAAWMKSNFYVFGGAWQVEIVARVKCKGITSYTCSMVDYSQFIARPLRITKESYAVGKDCIEIREYVEIYASNQSDLIKRLEEVIVEIHVQTADGMFGTSDYTRTEKPAWID